MSLRRPIEDRVWHSCPVKTSPKAKKLASSGTRKAAGSRAPKKAVASRTPTKASSPRGARPAKKSAVARPSGNKKPAARVDLGAPIDGFFARHPAPLRAILEALRVLVEEAAPDAVAAIKWGMPFYTIGPAPMCALAAFKSHVNLILAGPEGTFADPVGLLEGEGKTGRHLKLRGIEELPRDAVRGWLRTAAHVARTKARS
jgi:hypothetical protein